MSCKKISDSKYIVDAINLGWTMKWQSYGWYKSAKSKHRPVQINDKEPCKRR